MLLNHLKWDIWWELKNSFRGVLYQLYFIVRRLEALEGCNYGAHYEVNLVLYHFQSAVNRPTPDAGGDVEHFFITIIVNMQPF